jgi:hypothetical protein
VNGANFESRPERAQQISPGASPWGM